FRRADQAQQHPQRGRLARAVRPEVAEDISFFDRQVDVVDRDEVSVPLDEPARGDGPRVGHPSARAAASAAAGGTDPARTNETPPLRHVSAVPSCVASSWAVTPSSETVGKAPSIPDEPPPLA